MFFSPRNSSTKRIDADRVEDNAAFSPSAYRPVKRRSLGTESSDGPKEENLYQSIPMISSVPLPVSREISEAEDEALREAVIETNMDWNRISQIMSKYSFTRQLCIDRWSQICDQKKSGPWTKTEDEVLIAQVNRHGASNWTQIAKFIPGRVGKQCRERWMNHLNPNVVKSEWTPEEDKILVEAQGRLGNKWTQISKLLPGRTENNVKNHWNSLINKNFFKAVTSAPPSEVGGMERMASFRSNASGFGGGLDRTSSFRSSATGFGGGLEHTSSFRSSASSFYDTEDQQRIIPNKVVNEELFPPSHPLNNMHSHVRNDSSSSSNHHSRVGSGSSSVYSGLLSPHHAHSLSNDSIVENNLINPKRRIGKVVEEELEHQQILGSLYNTIARSGNAKPIPGINGFVSPSKKLSPSKMNLTFGSPADKNNIDKKKWADEEDNADEAMATTMTFLEKEMERAKLFSNLQFSNEDTEKMLKNYGLSVDVNSGNRSFDGGHSTFPPNDTPSGGNHKRGSSSDISGFNRLSAMETPNSYSSNNAKSVHKRGSSSDISAYAEGLESPRRASTSSTGSVRRASTGAVMPPPLSIPFLNSNNNHHRRMSSGFVPSMEPVRENPMTARNKAPSDDFDVLLRMTEEDWESFNRMDIDGFSPTAARSPYSISKKSEITSNNSSFISSASSSFNRFNSTRSESPTMSDLRNPGHQHNGSGLDISFYQIPSYYQNENKGKNFPPPAVNTNFKETVKDPVNTPSSANSPLSKFLLNNSTSSAMSPTAKYLVELNDAYKSGKLTLSQKNEMKDAYLMHNNKVSLNVTNRSPNHSSSSFEIKSTNSFDEILGLMASGDKKRGY